MVGSRGVLRFQVYLRYEYWARVCGCLVGMGNRPGAEQLAVTYDKQATGIQLKQLGCYNQYYAVPCTHSISINALCVSLAEAP